MFWWNLFSILQLSLQPIVKKALFLPFLRSLSITYFDNLESGKKLLFWKKVLKKSWVNIDPKICMNPGSWIQCVSNMFNMLMSKFCSSKFKSASCWLACASPSDSRDVAKSRSSENWVCMIWETDQIWRLFSFKNGPGMVTV